MDATLTHVRERCAPLVPGLYLTFRLCANEHIIHGPIPVPLDVKSPIDFSSNRVGDSRHKQDTQIKSSQAEGSQDALKKIHAGRFHESKVRDLKEQIKGGGRHEKRERLRLRGGNWT